MGLFDESLTLGESIRRFNLANGIDASAAASHEHWYPGKGILHFQLPNFAWRKRAIGRHDAHHAITGYPCTRAGEMQMAAWEFAAGRYRHPAATAFCLPLVAMGAIAFPRRTLAAFVRGCRSHSLYSSPLTNELLSARIGDLQRRLAPDTDAPATRREALAYAGLVAASLAWSLAPFLLFALMLFWIWQ